jgi:ubiquinone/menaquinone biosynthesis C-methylase UbiE
LRKILIKGLLYDGILESMLINIKKKVDDYVFAYDLFPVLDICCGTGVQCHRISRKSPEVAGLDLDLSMILYAKSKYPELPFICADAVRIPFRDSSFKGAVISYALHEKSPDTRSLMLKEVRRILSPGGKVVFVDFDNPWSLKSRLARMYVWVIERMAGRDHFGHGREFLKKGGLKAFLVRNGWKEIERHDVELAHTSIVVAGFETEKVSSGNIL